MEPFINIPPGGAPLLIQLNPKPKEDSPKPKEDLAKPLTESEIYGLLLVFQIPIAKHFIKCLSQMQACLDASSTGIGKSYVSCAVAALLGYDLFVVCPKNVLSMWRKVAKIFRIKVLGTSNYESLKGGNYYNTNNIKEKCPYIDVISQNYKWNLPARVLLVFDEVHKCKTTTAQNSKLLISSKGGQHKIMMLSATVADSAKLFANFGYMLDLCNSPKIFNIYLKALQKIAPHMSVIMSLHKKIFPSRGARLTIEELGDLFPRNQVAPETYTMGEDIERQIQEQYQLLSVAVDDLKKKEAEASCALAKMTRARQKIEALKVQSFIELIQDYRDNGFSVVVFFNYCDTLNLVAAKTGINCVVHGQQSSAERDKNVEDFQENRTNVILCNIKSGGASISLHDIYGGHPRVALISPTWSAQDLVQALGRIHRANGKTACLQRIIFCAGTIEEDICANLQTKLDFYSQLNDGKEQNKLQLAPVES